MLLESGDDSVTAPGKICIFRRPSYIWWATFSKVPDQTMLPIDSLISILADGHFHSGVDLGRQLQVSRTAVWKNLEKLHDLGLEIETLKGKGYRLSTSLNLLRPDAILEQLPPAVRSRMAGFAVLSVVDSTNAWMQRYVRETGGDICCVCLAEFQSAGRGRRGRQWVSSFGENLCLSVGYTFREGFAALEGLSLAVGVMIADALMNYSVNQLQLKWPNDVWVAGKKLGGVLIELSGEQGGPCQVIVGVGLNVFMRGDAAGGEIDQAWTALASETGQPVDRNVVAAELVTALLQGLAVFERDGFAVFKERWEGLNALRDRAVRLSGAQEVEGVCRGIGRFGHLLVETSEGLREISAGEVSLRPL